MEREIEVAVPWGRLSARQWGPNEGRPVLALHGWLDNANTFKTLAPLFGARFRFIALDLAGHGHSDPRPGSMPYHFIDNAIDVVDALDSLGIEKLSLVGHSLGGAVSTTVAAALTDRIEKLVLLDSLGPLPEAPGGAPKRLAQYLDARRQGHARAVTSYADIDGAIAARLRAGGISQPAAKALAERGTEKKLGAVRWRFDRRLRLPAPFRFDEEQAQAFLAAVQCPTMVVRAEPGFFVDEAFWQQRLKSLRHLRLERLPGSHYVHFDSAAAVAQLVVPFLGE